MAWYDRHARVLPWRAPPGARAEPYRVWLSEVMLQQTTVKAVIPYFHAFTTRWPTVEALAAAPSEEVMAAWAGLGYYSRARKLIDCARMVATAHSGRFPNTETALLDLPGIGPYTAAAIAAIAFDRQATVVDGNVERVIARLFALETPVPAAKPEIRALAARLTPASRPGDHAQAMMDLGATICTPKKPACALCPWRTACRGIASADPERFPVKATKAARPLRRGTAYVVTRGDAVLLTRRPPRGLLGGMAAFPATDFVAGARPPAAAPLPECSYATLPEAVRHVFTHFELELTVAVARAAPGTAAPEGHWWQGVAGLGKAGLPSVMAKVAKAAGLV